MIQAILVLAVFLVFAFAMYRRWMPAILAVPLMAVVMMLAVGVPIAHVAAIVANGAGGSSSLAYVYVTVIFGALLARVTMDTGIARAVVNLAAEYGGEQPFVLALVLCAVVALLFISLSGLGAIIMVGSIVLPIMMTTGVPRIAAATMFLMSFALGFIFNIVNWTFYTKLFGVAPAQLWRYALVLAAINAAALALYAIVAFRRERAYATWAVSVERPSAPRVPWYALITPVMPIVLYFALHVDPMIAFVLSAFYGACVTRPRAVVPTLVAAAIRGLEDVAPAVLLFIGIGILLAATRAPELRAAFAPLARGWTSNPIAFVTIFGILSPLALYRGPLNPFGVGIAIFTVLLASHALPPVVLVAAVMAVVQVQNVCDPTNTANVWVANFTGVGIDTITRRTLPFQAGVATLATIAIVAGGPSLFGTQAFAAAIPRADAAMLPGFYAGASAANHVAVDGATDRLTRAATQEVITGLSRMALYPFPYHGDPNAHDCSGKSYAAYVYVSTTTFRLIEGTDLDVGLRLEDCGGWIVRQWHDHKIEAAPSRAEARHLADEGVQRLQRWAAVSPRAKALFARGVAAVPGDPPTYYYALFKTVDGYMRAYVRAGGPAYAAGLRTDDIVDKLDGKYWWEYGTFQTQARAYDGKPHSFDIHRGKTVMHIQLGVPFVASRKEP